MADPRRRPGPKGKAPEEGARISHSVRLKPSVAHALRNDAKLHNRTISEEIEMRVNASFEHREHDTLLGAMEDAVDTLTRAMRGKP